MRAPEKEGVVTIDLVVGLVVSVLLLGYLVYALLKPEKF